jgi:hypothetical protein
VSAAGISVEVARPPLLSSARSLGAAPLLDPNVKALGLKGAPAASRRS